MGGDEEAAAAGLARWHELLTDAIVLYGGLRVAYDAADGVIGAFTRAPDAVATALEVQGALPGTPRREALDLPVRVALYSGEGQLGGNDHRGHRALTRCARLLAICHGGQTLLSGATRELIADRGPQDVTFRDLGSRRLKDAAPPSGYGSSAMPRW